MPDLLRMPEVAAGSRSAKLAEWLTDEHQTYTTADSLAAIETDKAVVDLNPEADGVLLRHLVPAGAEVAVGDPIALIAAPDETVADVDAALAALALPNPAGTNPAGTNPAGTARRTDDDEQAIEPSAVANLDGHAASGTRPGVPGTPARIFTSPIARRLATDAGIPVTSIVGTGPHGRIVRADVERAIAQQAATATDTATATGSARTTSREQVQVQVQALSTPAGPAASGSVDEPHTRFRRAIAQRLTQSKQTIPHFYVRGSAQVDELLALRAQLNQDGLVKVSVNDLVVKAVGCAHRRMPAANVSWGDEACRRYESVDVGVAVAAEAGLVSPVVRGVDRLSIGAIAETTRDLVDRARSGRLRQHELEGGTTAVTNLGMYGTEEFAAIINPPQSSILAVGAARKEAVVTGEGGIEARTVLRVTLSVDHRAIDGAVAAQWMRSFVELLERPLSLLV